jgi:hypothetical protein
MSVDEEVLLDSGGAWGRAPVGRERALHVLEDAVLTAASMDSLPQGDTAVKLAGAAARVAMTLEAARMAGAPANALVL